VTTVADLRTLADLGDLEGRRVLLRVDFNVPVHEGRITDDGRIRAALPTIAELAAGGARVLLCSHLGRPAGPDPALSLAPVSRRLSQLIGLPVPMAADVVGASAHALADRLMPGGIAMLENRRRPRLRR
jgi:phosphoglycerate kinase